MAGFGALAAGAGGALGTRAAMGFPRLMGVSCRLLAFARGERRLAATGSRVSAVTAIEEPNNRIAVAKGQEIYIGSDDVALDSKVLENLDGENAEKQAEMSSLSHCFEGKEIEAVFIYSTLEI